jgi:hypothetical protein
VKAQTAHWSSLLVLLSLVTLAAPARAQHLERALELERSGRLVDALDEFEEALMTSGNSRRELVTIFRHLSVLRFASGDPAGTRDSVMRLLAVSPTATLPDSAPPELQELFEDATARWRGRTLRARIEEGSGSNGTILVRIVDDLMDMVAGVEITADSRVIGRAEGFGSEFEVTLEETNAPEDEVVILLIGENGGILWEGASELPTAGAGRAPNRERPHRTSTARRWQRIVASTLLGVGLATAVAGSITLAVHDTSTGEQRILDGIIYERYRQTLIGGVVLLGLGLATAIGGLVWLLIDRRRSPGGDGDGDGENLSAEMIARW